MHMDHPVVGSGEHAHASDGHGDLSERGVVPHLDGGVEGVHVDVHDRPREVTRCPEGPLICDIQGWGVSYIQYLKIQPFPLS